MTQRYCQFRMQLPEQTCGKPARFQYKPGHRLCAQCYDDMHMHDVETQR